MLKRTNFGSLFSLGLCLVACSLVHISCNKDPRETLDEVTHPPEPIAKQKLVSIEEISVPSGFAFSMNRQKELQISVKDTANEPVKGARFFVYSDSPELGGQLMGTGKTDAFGIFSSSIALAEARPQVYVKTSHKDLEAGKFVSLLASSKTELDWELLMREPLSDSFAVSPSVIPDFDQDGIPDLADPDDDNDGIPDLSEIAKCKNERGSNVTLAAWYHTTDRDAEPTSLASNITALPEILGPGWTGHSYDGQAGSRLDLMDATTPQTLGEAIEGGNYIDYIVFPENGYVFNLQTIGFAWNDVDRSPKQTFSVSIFSNIDSFRTPLITHTRPDEHTSYREEGIFINQDRFKAISTQLIFRIYVYGPQISGQAILDTRGENAIIWDDFSLRGKVLYQCDEDRDGLVNVFDTDSDGDLIPDGHDTEPLVPQFTDFIPQNGRFNSYAFESDWPAKGDYDFNDVILDYRYEVHKNSEGLIESLDCHFVLRALGTSIPHGFGLMFEGIQARQVEQVTGTFTSQVSLKANGCEQGQRKAVIIVYEDGHSLLGGGGLSSQNVGEGGETDPVEISVKVLLSETKRALGKINPFLFVQGERGKEIHLKGYTPTDLADKGLFNTGEDASADSMRYQSRGGLPWGLDLPGSFAYPKEGEDLNHAYPKLLEWVESNGFNSPEWYAIENSNIDKLFRP